MPVDLGNAMSTKEDLQNPLGERVAQRHTLTPEGLAQAELPPPKGDGAVYVYLADLVGGAILPLGQAFRKTPGAFPVATRRRRQTQGLMGPLPNTCYLCPRSIHPIRGRGKIRENHGCRVVFIF